MSDKQHIYKFVGEPTEAPEAVMAHGINGTTFETYLSVGTESPRDWWKVIGDIGVKSNVIVTDMSGSFIILDPEPLDKHTVIPSSDSYQNADAREIQIIDFTFQGNGDDFKFLGLNFTLLNGVTTSMKIERFFNGVEKYISNVPDTESTTYIEVSQYAVLEFTYIGNNKWYVGVDTKYHPSELTNLS